MANFRYMARERGGSVVNGVVVAASAEEAARLIRGRSLFPTKVEKEAAGDFSSLFSRSKRVPAAALAKFYSQFADLLKSGVPLLRSLDLLQRQSPNERLREVLADIRQRVADGQTVADAMAVHETIFGELSVSMVRAGQEAGFLEDVFKRIAVFTEKQEELKGKVVGAMAYPVALIGLGTVIVGVLLVYFVPKFAKVFDKLRDKGEMPEATEWLLAFSAFLQDYGLYVLVAAAGGFVLLRRQMATPAGRRFVDTWKLKAPLFGKIIRDLAITRFNRVLGTLRKNGVPILAALRIAKDSTGNVLMRDAIAAAADNVQAGDKLATPLRKSGVFPAEIVEMIEVAEESNNLEHVLLESADSLESQTTRQLELAVRFLEPLLLLVMAVVTMGVVMALLLPVMKMSSAL